MQRDICPALRHEAMTPCTISGSYIPGRRCPQARDQSQGFSLGLIGGEFDSFCHLIQGDYLEESSKRPPWHRFLQAVRKFLLNCETTSCTGRPLFRTWVGLRKKGGFHGMSFTASVEKRTRGGNESLGDPGPGHEAPMLGFGEHTERWNVSSATMGSHPQGANQTGEK